MTRTIKLSIALIICLIVMLWPVSEIFILRIFMLNDFYFWFINIMKFLGFVLFWVFAILLVTDALKLIASSKDADR